MPLSQLISSAVLHLYAYIRRFLSYLSLSPTSPSNATPFLSDSDSASLDDLEQGRLDTVPPSPQGRAHQPVLDISRADSELDRSSYNPLRPKSHSLSHFSPPDSESEPSLHQRKRSSTVWFKKPRTSRDYNYDDVVARVRRAIEDCAEEEDVRAIFDRRSAWDTIKSVIIEDEDDEDDSFSTPPEISESELAYTNQDSAMVSSVSTFVTGFPTYKSLDKVLAALALQSEVSWSDLVSFSEDNEAVSRDTSCSDLLSLEEL